MQAERHLAPALAYADLPDGLCEKAAEYQSRAALYTYLSKPLIDSLTAFLAGRNVVEAYAGRGHLSALLREKGIAIRPTSLRSGHDASGTLGHVIVVEDLSVAEAVTRYRDWMDVLLVCWPVADDSLRRALAYLPEGCLIVFIGEVTDYTRKPFAFLGGCANDGFFEAVEERRDLTAQLRYPTFRQDQIKVYMRR